LRFIYSLFNIIIKKKKCVFRNYGKKHRSYDSFQLNTIRFIGLLIIFFIVDGQNKANRPQVHSPKGAPQAACSSEDCPEISPHRFRREETPPIQTWNGRPQIDQKIPKECNNFLSPQSF
jgi:hypothetical protein